MEKNNSFNPEIYSALAKNAKVELDKKNVQGFSMITVENETQSVICIRIEKFDFGIFNRKMKIKKLKNTFSVYFFAIGCVLFVFFLWNNKKAAVKFFVPVDYSEERAVDIEIDLVEKNFQQKIK
ncbi:MAG: hypothetical protein L6V90_10260 [Treponema succinifaciens]|nr:MAG: hypothetical protein L6V90_10260 [Treponema succinifaciens]